MAKHPNLTALLGPSLDAAAERRLASGASADLGLSVDGVGRCRLNVFQTSRGRAAAIRLLRAAPPALAQLRVPVSLDDLVELPHGLVIVCGPTGSGKSTTLAALAREALDRRSCVLLTLEDPIEYEIPPGARGIVRQRQVGRDVLDFATGLRDGLREDPDILLIGEMRDPETVSLALTAAETGHLVLASLHSRSAASAVDRIIDTYPSDQKPQIRTQLADALQAVVSQRLIPRAQGDGRVVAGEVRTLAQRSKDAAKKTETLIKASVSSAERGEMICRDVDKSFEAIVHAGTEVGALVRAIASASEEQARGIHQINEVVASIDGLTQRNAASSEESASSAEELSSQSEELATLVATFTLRHGAAPMPTRPPPPSRAMGSMRPRPSAPRNSRRPMPMPTSRSMPPEPFPEWDA